MPSFKPPRKTAHKTTGNGRWSVEERVFRILRRRSTPLREDQVCRLLHPGTTAARVRGALVELEAACRVVRSADLDGSVRPCWAAVMPAVFQP